MVVPLLLPGVLYSPPAFKDLLRADKNVFVTNAAVFSYGFKQWLPRGLLSVSPLFLECRFQINGCSRFLITLRLAATGTPFGLPSFKEFCFLWMRPDLIDLPPAATGIPFGLPSF